MLLCLCDELKKETPNRIIVFDPSVSAPWPQFHVPQLGAPSPPAVDMEPQVDPQSFQTQIVVTALMKS